MNATRRAEAVILAGGLGTRLRAAVADRPKVLAEVGGRPFVSYLLDRLEEAGIRRAVLCIGYRGEQVREVLGRRHGGMTLAYSEEGETLLGTGGALRQALEQTDAEELLVLNGDSCLDTDLRAYLGWFRESLAEAALALAEVPDTRRFGRVELASNGRISAFAEKGAAEGPGLINAGVYALCRARLAELPAGEVISLERDVFPRWLEEGLYGYHAPGNFLDIGTPESYAQAESFLGAELLA